LSDSWTPSLDRIRSSVNELDQSLIDIPPETLGEIVGVLRGVNRHIWRIIDALEAGRVKYLYDVASLVRAVSEDNLDLIENFMELVGNDVLSFNHKELLRFAAKRGIDVTEYLEEPT
jgi:hypothetical protein